MYLNAKCSKELFLNDAIFLYDNLTNTFPYHQYKDEMYKDLGLIYYREKKFSDAISSFTMVNVLSTDQLFKLEKNPKKVSDREKLDGKEYLFAPNSI